MHKKFKQQVFLYKIKTKRSYGLYIFKKKRKTKKVLIVLSNVNSIVIENSCHIVFMLS